MVINNGFEEQLRKLISKARDELNQKDEELKSLENSRKALDEELQSYENSLHNYLKRIGKAQEEEQPLDWDKLLKDCHTHRQRLLTIAKHSDDELRLSVVTDILYSGKYIKSKSRANAYVQLYNVIMNMVDTRVLEKIGRGRYRITQHSRLL
jgi:septal ring factor EnvC (AmiA/AmiB activator)